MIGVLERDMLIREMEKAKLSAVSIYGVVKRLCVVSKKVIQ